CVSHSLVSLIAEAEAAPSHQRRQRSTIAPRGGQAGSHVRAVTFCRAGSRHGGSCLRTRSNGHAGRAGALARAKPWPDTPAGDFLRRSKRLTCCHRDLIMPFAWGKVAAAQAGYGALLL